VIEPAGLRLKLGGYVPQGGPSGNMGKHHGHELIPSGKGSELSLRPETVFFDSFEIMFRNKLKQLAKDCATMRHGLILLLF
jgi:hypothetical protein